MRVFGLGVGSRDEGKGFITGFRDEGFGTIVNIRL